MTISITRVYTRTGDKGETGLVGGTRVPKDSLRIEAYGTMDELNAIVGIVRTFNEERLADGEHHRWLEEQLHKIQNQLFDLGSELATPPGAEYEGQFKFTETEVKGLEELMDHCQKDLEPLKSFTLPGGGRINAYMHLARTVCRRFERQVWRLAREEPVNEWDIKYINRLSDVFFVLGRWVVKHMGEKEYLWERGLSAHRRPRKKIATT
jgi:cob(I)alamin adenosyltransferase